MKSLTVWAIWLIIFLLGLSYFIFKIVYGEDKSDFIIGEASYGHHQIEMACETCHSSAFGGKEVLQDACIQCHGQELERANDSHPKSKFTDPRNADLLKIIDARFCISCHTEHHQERTLEMGLTLPKDYCFHCHEDIAEDRVSHQNLPFDSCATAGCHNFHDNKALYEKFLLANANQPWLAKHWQENLLVDHLNSLPPKSIETLEKSSPIAIENNDAPSLFANAQITQQWHNDKHSQAGVNCSGCHVQNEPDGWIEKPNHAQCKSCHERETEGFSKGKHGMRSSHLLSKELPAISPADSHLPFNSDHLQQRHGCNACHNAHSFNTEIAAVDSCLGCHDDDHSNSFLNSPHGKLWQAQKSTIPFASVSCATCHLPRELVKINEIDYLMVQHNQNDNLKPNEKMIRPVCMQCHGLEFAIDSLADEDLIKSNFTGRPSLHVKSIDWAVSREAD